MSKSARDRILGNLRTANLKAAEKLPKVEVVPVEKLSVEDKVKKIKELLEAVRSEVHVVKSDKWLATLQEQVKKRGIKTLLCAPKTPVGKAVQKAWPKNDSAELVSFEGNIEEFKPRLFEMEAAITGSTGGIAENGSLILQPNQDEPRLISLIPPIHFVVLDSRKIYNDFNEAMREQGWGQEGPVNRILISGPSKTADIELTLAFGVHGPRELVVLILE